jgi:uncharacterized SAM-binding protein YcdF (DUF218 family)
MGRSSLTVSKPLQNADAIVLLAGSYEERAPAAADIFLSGNAKCIILANDGVRRGWSSEYQRNLFSIERSEEALVKRGVPRQSIIRLPFLKSGTIYDALAVRDYVVRYSIHSILLVTSDYHTRRTLWTFQKIFQQLSVTVGIEPVRTPSIFYPSIMLEYIKFAYYLIRFGWLGDIPVVGV